MSDGHATVSPAPLDGLIDYQGDSIVSRVLLKSPAGTVTLFAFDRGQELSEHTAPFDALVQVLDGTAAITVGGTRHDVVAGHVIRLPGGIPHAVAATTRFRMLLTMIRAKSD
ncbi:MAG: cupin domain-containing protein [Gemmatimonadota bacterium]